MDIEALRKDGWIEAVFRIEVIGATKEVVEMSLKTHVKKLENVKDVHIIEKNFHSIIELENVKNLKKAYSQYVEIRLLARNVLALLSIIILYGPSSIELISPSNVEIDIAQLQNICNTIATLVHRFAEAGIGGIVITPE